MKKHAGDPVEVGTYQCVICGEKIKIETPDDLLPECPVCGATTFEKIE